MLKTPFYDPKKTYEENYKNGPFGAFANGKVYKERGKLENKYIGRKVFLPFGIAAGPLINGKFIKTAFEKGFDICVYKTVRTRVKKVNDWPNILPVSIKGNLTLENAKKGITTKKAFSEPLAITNSFGNPSYPPEIWQEDIKNIVEWANIQKGKVVYGMIEGTSWNDNFSPKDFLNDWVLAAKLMNETKVHGVEANFSCPNEGNKVKTLLCFDIEQAVKIAYAVKNKIGNNSLVIKISFFENNNHLELLIKGLGKIVDGISAINTIPAPVFDQNGNQALPGGPWRLKSGICGKPIKWAGLNMVKRLKKLRDENSYKFKIIGVGGVTSSKDYLDYIKAGADAVMSATGAMWNPYLAQEIKK